MAARAPAPSAAPVPVRLCARVSVWREEAWVTGQGLGEELGSPSRSLTPRFRRQDRDRLRRRLAHLQGTSAVLLRPLQSQPGRPVVTLASEL